MRVKYARQTFLGFWAKLMLEGRLFEVWNGHQLRDFTYVAADTFLMATANNDSNGKILILGRDTSA